MRFKYGTASWMDAEAPARHAADEEQVRRRFWCKLRGLAARLPFAEDLIARTIARSIVRRLRT
jgi:hypothetical protein